MFNRVVSKSLFRFYLASMALFLLAGGYIFLLGLNMTVDATGNKKKCTVHTECEIVKVSYEEFERRPGEIDMVYVPVFRYSLNGADYNYKSDTVYSVKSFEVGDKTEIYFDPDDPYNVYLPEYSDEISTSRWLMVIGAVVALAPVVIALFFGILGGIIYGRKKVGTTENDIQDHFDINNDYRG